MEDRRYNPSRKRIPEAEFGAGAALVVITAAKGFGEGCPCSYLVFAPATQVSVQYGPPEGYGQFSGLPTADLTVNFASGTFGRCALGEKLTDKLKALRGDK